LTAFLLFPKALESIPSAAGSNYAYLTDALLWDKKHALPVFNKGIFLLNENNIKM